MTTEELRDALVADYHMQSDGDGWTPDDLTARLDAIIAAARAETTATLSPTTPEQRKVYITPELVDALSHPQPDACVLFEWGEPDGDGFYSPVLVRQPSGARSLEMDPWPVPCNLAGHPAGEHFHQDSGFRLFRNLSAALATLHAERCTDPGCLHYDHGPEPMSTPDDRQGDKP